MIGAGLVTIAQVPAVRRIVVISAADLVVGSTAVAQTNPMTDAGCLDLSQRTAKISLSGRLSLQPFAGPPNFDSTSAGDATIAAPLPTLS